ncbi:tRNA splicing ligase [Bacillus phage 015DV004]|nr:tRNA splicing ligase [Bacillus phage 015DV004]
MIEINGKHNSAKIFTDNVEVTAMSQITELCNQEFTAGNKIRIMPDVHAGKGCTIGTTMTITDKVVPNLVGADIGCGLLVAFLNIDKSEINFDQLDENIRLHIPSGQSIREKEHRFVKLFKDFKDVKAPINVNKANKSLGTLGGGNHFIEVNEVAPGKVALVVHSGSRSLGGQIAKYYQNRAYDAITSVKGDQQRIIHELKAQGRHQEIEAALKGVQKPKVKKELAYLEGEDFKNYLHDMKIAQQYAYFNRGAIITDIIDNMRWDYTYDRFFDTIHNYIDMDHMVLRKGAISARKGEEVIIPINMRDGSILATGKGNDDWNQSGPHGAGRLMSRTKAKENLNMADFFDTMDGVWTTSVGAGTLDEAPMAYKPMEAILDNIEDSLEVNKVIKPVYNFKAV